MIRPLSLPNLPKGPVTVVALSQYVPESVRRALVDRGIRTITISPCSGLPVPERCHPDMLLCHLGGSRLLAGDGDASYLQELQELGFCWELADSPPKGSYPDTISLNALLLKDRIVGLLSHVDKKITDNYKPKRQKRIFCRQGYTRCSVCVVDQNAVITADRSIFSALTRCDPSIEVLLISPGSVRLKGYPYGFIGGCCGLLDKNLLGFTGAIEQHPDFADIHAFLVHHGVEYLSLSSEPLEDVGGIIPLCEDVSY